MPTSEIANVPPIIEYMARLQPKSIADLGIGFGKYGVLAREWLDITPGRIKREDWQIHIAGYEAFEQYRNPCWDVYDQVFVRDFTEMLIAGVDLVLMIDSLEHLEKAKGREVLSQLIQRNKNVIVSCPDGDYPQGAVNGNEYERHRAVWRAADLKAMGGRIIHQGVCSVAVFQHA